MNTEKNQQAKNGGNLNIELEVKKSAKANLEQNKFLWLLMGCVIVFSVTFAVIEWTTFEKQEKKEKKAQQQALDIPIDILVPFTVPEKKVVPPPPEAKKIVDIIEIVEDEAEVEESELVSIEEMGEVVEITDNANIVVEEVVEEEQVFQVVEQQPEFPGGMKALMKYLQDNINYPRISRDNNSQGKAFIRFVVNSDGSIQGVEVLKSSGDIYLDKEAMRVVENMPKWAPGKQAGKPVRVFFTLPVTFRLQ
ncbi:MAG: energy transducer TonB [Bacteroidaceae bacterium]|nr:energy transducer TonB [Bacteroidaceae bacterium]